MCRSLNRRDDDRGNSVFKRPTVALLDEKEWSCLQQRYRMSPRELQVAKLVCQGFSNGEITKVLKIKQGTVKTHLRNIYRRVHIKNKITLLLKFVDATAKFSIKSKITLPIPIVDIEKPRKKTATPTKTPEKRK